MISDMQHRGSFLSSFAAGSLSSLAGSGYMMSGLGNTVAGTYAFSAVAGGLGSKLTGGDFWQGAGIGLMTAGLNHVTQGIGQKTDWNGPSHAEKIQAFLDAYQEAIANDNPYFDLNEYVTNFQKYGSGGQYMDYLTIDGVEMPVFLDIGATRESLKISTSVQTLAPTRPFPSNANIRVNGIHKTGVWAQYGFNQYTNTPVGKAIPRALIQVPIKYDNHFYKYIIK